MKVCGRPGRGCKEVPGRNWGEERNGRKRCCSISIKICFKKEILQGFVDDMTGMCSSQTIMKLHMNCGHQAPVGVFGTLCTLSHGCSKTQPTDGLHAL